MNTSLRSTLAAASLTAVLLTGCRINEHKTADGKNDNVDISTPFGSMHVNGNAATDTAAIGITAYPGAVPVSDDNGKDSGSANINMSFGDFHLGVKATSFQTADKQEKVLAFYRKDLAKYGDVIECKDNTAIGKPTSTSQGLTCDTKEHNHISNGDTDLELRAGSEQHQHIVGVEARNGGTKISLIALDLPGSHDSKSVE